jgi:hypothetical protein
VIQKIEIMPLVLARCPAFTPIWEKHRLSWEGEEAGIYNDLAEFATFIVNCYAQGHIEPVVAAFALIEELLVGGNEEVRNAAAIGFLEDVQNIASWRPLKLSFFFNGWALNQNWLGRKLKKCGEANLALQMWFALNKGRLRMSRSPRKGA